MSFTLKTIRTTLALGKGTFTGGGNTKTFEGFATTVTVEKPGAPDKNKATVSISGMKLEDMQQATTLGFGPLKNLKNYIAIEAGEQNSSALSVVFKGEITSAFANFNNAPDVTFEIEAMTGSYPSLIPAKPMSVNGSVTAESLIKQWATEAGYGFKNEGVTSSVKNSVFYGSPLHKANALATQLGFELLTDDQTLVMIPANGVRTGTTPELSRDSGLLSYPTFTSDGINFRCLYNPDLAIGACVQIKSVVPFASGKWKITKLSHKLEAYKVGGTAWESEVEGTWLK